MKICGALITLSLTITLSNCAAIERQSENELNPLNDTDDDSATNDDRGDRDKRKIGVIKLGVTNGILNFVFGKLDAFIDAKTKALHVLDEANKAKNHAYGIDPSRSATGEFISQLISQKIKASSASIGPVVNSATTFLGAAKSGLTGALVNKIAPLSSLSSGVVGGLSNGSGGSGGQDNGEGDGSSSAALGGILSSGISILGSLSGSSGSLSNGSNGSNGGDTTVSDDDSSSGDDAGGINIGVGMIPITTTTDYTPEFNRQRVSLDVPPTLIGGGFTLATKITDVLSQLIMRSAHRTEQILEVLKPLFRGIFSIKGLPSDNFEIPTKYPSK